MTTPTLAAPGPPAPTAAANSYDEVPYESHPYTQTHPARLATVATLFGLTPPPVAKCRVLELGCASGGNLIPMAEAFPGGEFVGVDLSARQVADGVKIAAAAGIRNVELRHADILAIDDSWGEFDYVICHGVFSWVPDPVRAKILDVFARHLTPTGVAYVSYNTYPGWHMRGMIRDMMRFHATRFGTPAERVAQARALLDFLAQSAPADGGAYSTLLRAELEALRHQADHYLYHEHLEDVNAPLYFHQFMELATKYDLQYLGEARLTTMVLGNFTPEVEKALRAVAGDQTQAEQYLDFVRNRTFRETLLVKAGVTPRWGIDPEAVRGLHVTTPTRLAEDRGDVRSRATAHYQTRTGMTLSTSSPVLKAALKVLRDGWPATVAFPDLDADVNRLLGGPGDGGRALATGLLNAYLASDVIGLTAAPVPAVPVGEKPAALAAARARIAAGELGVANRRHEFVRPPDLERRLVPLLDGTRDRAALVEAAVGLALAGGLSVQRDGHPLTDPAAIREALGPAVDRALAWLAGTAMLGG